MAADGSIIIDTKLDTSGFTGGSEELLKAVRDVSSAVDNLGDNMMRSFGQVIPLLTTIANKELVVQQTTVTTTQAVNTATAAVERQEKTSTTTLEKVQAKLDAAKAKIGQYYAELEEIQKSTDEWLKSSQNSEQTENILAIEAQQIEALNEKYAPQLAAIRKLEEEYELLAQKAREAAAAKDAALGPTPGTEAFEEPAEAEEEASLFTRIAERANEGAKTAGEWFVSLGSKIKSAATHLASFAGRLARLSFRAVTRGISALATKLREMVTHNRTATLTTQGLIKGLLSLKSIIIGRIKSRIIQEITQGIQTALESLRKFSGEYNAAMNNLKNSAAALSGNIAVSIGNFVTAIEPAITAIIDAVSRAISYLNALFAMLGGKNTVTVAKKQMKDYGAATESAAGSAEKLNRQVYGFDQLNRRSSTGGGGGGGTAGGAEDLFEEVPIESLLPEKLESLFENIKKAFTEGRWYDLGHTIGEGLNEALQYVDDWINNTFRPKGVEIARDFAEALNGLTDGINWDLLGKTVADGINAVFDIVNTFLTTYDFKNLGTRVGQAINSLFANIDWDLIGATFANKFNAILDFLYGLGTEINWAQVGLSLAEGLQSFVDTLNWDEIADTLSVWAIGLLTAYSTAVENVNWYDLGVKVRECIERIDWAGVSKAFFEAIGATLGGLAAFLWGLIEEAWNSVVEWWYDVAYEDGEFTIEGLLQGIKDAIIGIGTWLYNNVWVPFRDGFKKAFKISSPSKAMQEMGNYIVEGLLLGLTEKWSTITTYLAQKAQEIKGNLKAAWDNVKQTAIEKWDAIKTDITTRFETIKTDVGTKADDIKAKLQGAWDEIKTNTSTKWEEIKQSVSGSWDSIKTTIQTKWDEIKGIISNVSWTNIGSNLVSGLENGIKSGWDSVTTTVSNMATAITKTATTRLQEKSPSKVFRQIGAYIVDGLTLGIEDRKPSALVKTQQLADSVIDRMGGLVTPAIAAGTVVPPRVAVSDDAPLPTELASLTTDMGEYMADNNYLLRQIIDLLRRINPTIDADSLAAALTSAQRRTVRAYGG